MAKQLTLLVFYLLWMLNHLVAFGKEPKPAGLLLTAPSTDSLLNFTGTLDFPETDVIQIPLIRSGNLFFIEAKVDSLQGNFILDLGAPYLVLNSTYFRNYQTDENYYSGTLLSGNDYVRRTKVSALEIQDLQYLNLAADVTDLGEIENQRKIKILGLLGVKLFTDFVFDLDLRNQQLVLHRKRSTLETVTPLLLESPIKLSNNVISITGMSNGVKLQLSLDTGAELNILHNKLSPMVYEDMKILRTSVLLDGKGGKTETLFVIISNLAIEENQLPRMRTLVLNLATMSRAYGNRIDGMLGFPFFSQGRVILDFENKKLQIYEYNN